jgi:diguanylate cyclase (GGDEF)-like protein
MPGIGPLAEQILSGTQSTHQYQRDGKQIVLNARNIPELKWHLIVEQDEDDALSAIRRTLYLNIAIVLLVGSLSIWLTGLTINRYQRKLEDMAVTDKLTGLANRQAFAPLIEQTLSEIKRNPEPLSLIIADIDHFKQVNDSHGHQVGDRVLQHTAESIANALRDSDLIFRWGGEEFLIIVRGCEGKDAFRLAEKLRQAVESTSVEVDGKAVRTTLSTGVAVRREGEDVDSLIGRADRALYAAKAAGRNCSRLSGET